MHHKTINPGRQEIVRLLNYAVRESQTIQILVDGEKGTASIKVQAVTIARFRDIYSMLQEMMPELTEEFA